MNATEADLLTALVIEHCARMVEKFGSLGYGTLAIAAMLRKESPCQSKTSCCCTDSQSCASSSACGGGANE